MKNDVIKEIKRNYLQLEKALIAELFMTVNAHHLTAGTFREKIWKGFFENIVPKKFTIEQGAFLIDSHGCVSGETDLVIFDEQYTPYVLRNRNIKFIPIEAVVAVIQCKSTAFPSNDLIAWENSIDLLKTSSDGYAGTVIGAINSNAREVRPLKIICGLFDRSDNTIANFLGKRSKSDLLIVANSKKEKNGIYKSTDGKITIYSRHESVGGVFREIITPKEEKPAPLDVLQFLKLKTEKFRIYSSGNKSEEISLLTLVFQLNQYLMLINNPMFFPHRAYIDMFNKSDHNLD